MGAGPIADCMDGNAYFPSPPVATATLRDQVDLAQAAQASTLSRARETARVDGLACDNRRHVSHLASLALPESSPRSRRAHALYCCPAFHPLPASAFFPAFPI
jgi:hypothetical protein